MRYRKDDPRAWAVLKEWLLPNLPLYAKFDFGYRMYSEGPVASVHLQEFKEMIAPGPRYAIPYKVIVARNAFLMRDTWSERLAERLKLMVERERADWFVCLADELYPKDIVELASGYSWPQMLEELSDPESQEVLNCSPDVMIGKHPDFPLPSAAPARPKDPGSTSEAEAQAEDYLVITHW